MLTKKGVGMKDFKDKIAAITGAGTGTGRELAPQMTSDGSSQWMLTH